MPTSKSAKAQKVNLSHIKKGEYTSGSIAKEAQKEPTGMQTQFAWSAPERIWSPKTKAWYLSYAAIALTIILLTILSRYPAYPFIILGVVAFVALWFAQAAIPPHIQNHRITSKGIYTYDGLYTWKEINHFWFAVKNDQYLLYLDFPRILRQPRITLLVKEQDVQRIFDLLIAHENYGNLAEVEYNVFTKALYGEYLPISRFIADLDMPDEKEDIHQK